MRHLLRRTGFYLVALWASITLNFFIPRFAPGDPASALVASMQGRIQPEQLQALEVMFGISHESLWTQYVQYLGNLLHGNMGISLMYFPTPVTSVIADNVKWTLGLVGISTIISFLLGTLLGVLVSWRRNSRMGTLVPTMLTFLSAIPYFWLALISLYFLGYVLDWFPLTGGFDTSIDQGWSTDFAFSVIQHAILPAFTIVASSLAGWMLSMRNAMITTLSEDYVLMAEAKGLSQPRVMLAYAARNAILPNITGFALSLGFVVGGALLTEIVFSYPGIGFSLLQAVQHLDYALLQGIFLVIAVAILAANFLADLIYVFLDPRVRQERG
ncbi:MAG TPA: ABC transporter permease [Ktedonobacteraceae bacterium]|jgi:peptide/nickel transport system permease protein|nr:ABC transporter permease [Ktedonobacteraceae bacterium]